MIVSDETLRTLITVSGTALVAWLAAGLQGKRERGKEDREARAGLHERRREALVDAASALMQAVQAANRIRAGSAHLQTINEQIHANGASLADYQRRNLQSVFQPNEVTKQLTDTIAFDRGRAGEASNRIVQAMEAATIESIAALRAAIRYGSYPKAAQLSNTLAYDLHNLVEVDLATSGEGGDLKRGYVVAVARDLGALAAWEGDAAAAIKGRRKEPELPPLSDLRSLSSSPTFLERAEAKLKTRDG